MQMFLKAIVFATALAASAACGAKDKRQDQEAARAALLRGEILPLARILAVGAKAAPGSVVDVELKRKPRGFIYELKVLARDGVLREVEIDAKTGAVIEIEIEDK